MFEKLKYKFSSGKYQHTLTCSICFDIRMSSSALIKIYIQFTKSECSNNYMVLCNPFPDTSFTVKKKVKMLTKIM